MTRCSRINNWSLRRRTLLVCCTIVIGVWIAMVLSVCWHLTAHKKTQIRQYGTVLIDDISKWAQEYLQAYDYFTLRAQLHHYRHVAELHYAAIYDDTGRLIAFYPTEEPTVYESIEKFVDPIEFNDRKAIAEERRHSDHLLRFESNVKDAISGRNVGFVRIYLSETRALHAVTQVIWRIVGYGAVLVGILLFALSKFLSRLLVPLTSFARACATVEVSTDTVRVPGSENVPELHALMSAFNTMIQRIRQQQLRLMEQEKAMVMTHVAAQVSHDIRSPLTALRVLVGHLAGVPEEHRVMIRNAVQRIEDIANDLRAKQDLLPTEHADRVDDRSAQLLSSLIEPLISEKRTQHRAKLGVEIHAALDAGSYGLFATVHPTELKRVISNLINNAVEAMDRGLVTVAVRRDAERVVISVTDTGKGIPPELLPQLMQQGATFGKAGGSGLGLYHARTTMERWGGTLTLASQVGVGTTATVTLPRAEAPAWFVPELVLTPGSTIVIVDDDVSIHQIWQERLEAVDLPAHGMTLQHFSSGTEVVAWFHGQANSLFLCDYEFLGQPNNGLELIEQLGIHDRAILVTSHFDEVPIQQRCAALGVRLIPKGLAGFVPIRVLAGDPAAQIDVRADAAAAPPQDTVVKPTALVLDDDDGIRCVWPMEGRRLGFSAVTTFASMEECEASSPNYAQFDFAFVDKNIPDSAWRLDQVIAHLKACGVKKVLVASGESARELANDPQCAAADGVIPMKIPQKLPR